MTDEMVTIKGVQVPLSILKLRDKMKTLNTVYKLELEKLTREQRGVVQNTFDRENRKRVAPNNSVRCKHRAKAPAPCVRCKLYRDHDGPCKFAGPPHSLHPDDIYTWR